MAAHARCLAIVLVLWIVSSRPSASIRAGSNDSGSRSHSLQNAGANSVVQAALESLKAGDVVLAERLSQQEYNVAGERHDDRLAVRLLSGVAGCRMAQFDYRGALDAYLEVKKL